MGEATAVALATARLGDAENEEAPVGGNRGFVSGRSGGGHPLSRPICRTTRRTGGFRTPGRKTARAGNSVPTPAQGSYHRNPPLPLTVARNWTARKSTKKVIGKVQTRW
jgi:hypothetical protein